MGHRWLRVGGVLRAGDNLGGRCGVITGVQSRGEDFDQFVLGAGTGLMRMAVALTGDRTAAEDLLQDVLERMYVAWPRIDEPLAYARRSLVNASTNRWRGRGRRREIALSEAAHLTVPDRSDDHDRRDLVARAVAALPARQRAVVVLRFLCDLSEVDTASVLGCTAGTVKSQTARALARLRDLLDDASDAEPNLTLTRSIR
ncbi:MAG TPA: SigE family RNA polymerase sigma factor [Mycobacteriales bacterium]|nr:SigE family RNA polymerase sigma factor [Mycobacteriales bacterium]